MTEHAHHHGELKNPGTFAISPKMTKLFLLFLVIGIASFAWLMFLGDRPRAWSIFLINHFYFMGIAIGGIFLGVLTWCTGAMWTAPFRRIGESFSSYLPIATLTTIGVIVGAHDLYHWTHSEAVSADPILQGKAPYLNLSFFALRTLVVMGLWLFAYKYFVGNSLKQDQSKDYGLTLKNRAASPLFLIIFALSFTVMSFDQMMSLNPHWFSTIFGIYCFGGMFYSFMAPLCIVTLILKKSGHLKDFVNENHLHDIGKFMFAYTVFWAYIGFSQFMLIWYANLPEETGYYILRFQGKWLYVSIFLLVGKFLAPFLTLLPRGAKRSETRLWRVAWFMLIAHWVDVLWIVRPQFYQSGPMVSLLEVGVTFGFIGLFALVVARFLRTKNVVAIGDPRLHEAVFHHHQ